VQREEVGDEVVFLWAKTVIIAVPKRANEITRRNRRLSMGSDRVELITRGPSIKKGFAIIG
jgi:hypothetical protein